ncbi:MAG: ABC transporter ATP-binding protein, partial [Actinomycetes bacterium]
MSQQTTARPPAGTRPMHGPGAAMGAGMPAEKSLDFWPSARRLLGQLRPERMRAILVVALSVVSVSLSVLGPRILGHATNLIFAGVIGEQLPAGMTQDQASAAARASGQTGLANVLSGMTVVPGQGIDFTALARTLALVLVLYVAAAIAMWGQGYVLNGVVQRTVLRLRGDVEDKLHRLPLSYFDTKSRGELLSRVTNDIDNIQQTMQQTMSQLLTSLLTLVGVLAMMLSISPVLALVALVSVPLSVLVTSQIAKRSQPLFIEQWGQTGRLNGHIEETYT